MSILIKSLHIIKIVETQKTWEKYEMHISANFFAEQSQGKRPFGRRSVNNIKTDLGDETKSFRFKRD